MRIINKIALPPHEGEFTVKVSTNATVINVAIVDHVAYMLILEDDDGYLKERNFIQILGDTLIDFDPAEWKYINSYIFGDNIVNLFERV